MIILLLFISVMSFMIMSYFMQKAMDAKATTGLYGFINKYYKILGPVSLAAPLCVTIAVSSMLSSPSALEKLEEEYKNTPVYSIILEDLKTENDAFFIKCSLVVPLPHEGTAMEITKKWAETTKQEYEMVEPYKGLTIVTKKNGETVYAANPPGYEYVGDPRYGRWENREGMSPVWVWLAGYAVWNSTRSQHISFDSYQQYQHAKNNHTPYFGTGDRLSNHASTVATKTSASSTTNNSSSNNRSNTSSPVNTTKEKKDAGFSSKVANRKGRNKVSKATASYASSQESKPSFSSKRNSILVGKKTTFASKVSSRIGRSSTSMRSRSGGYGK